MLVAAKNNAIAIKNPARDDMLAAKNNAIAIKNPDRDDMLVAKNNAIANKNPVRDDMLVAEDFYLFEKIYPLTMTALWGNHDGVDWLVSFTFDLFTFHL
jgi:hypothetical protein